MEHPQVVSARKRLNVCRGHWADVEKVSGVSYSWLSKFARAEITNPTIESLQAVSDACDAVIANRKLQAPA